MLNALINVIIFLVNIIFGLYTFILLFRFFLQWVKADFYNPVCQFVVKTTNNIILPLRKFIPGFLNLDWSCIIAVYIIFLLENIILNILYNGFNFKLFFILLKPFLDIIFAIINTYIYLIIIRVISNWFINGNYNPLIVVIYQVTEPLISKVRDILRPMIKSSFDLSPLILLIFLLCIQIFFQSIMTSYNYY